MAQRFVTVPVRVWFGEGAVMRMLVVGVVDVAVFVLHLFVQMVMVVTLGQVQP